MSASREALALLDERGARRHLVLGGFGWCVKADAFVRRADGPTPVPAWVVDGADGYARWRVGPFEVRTRRGQEALAVKVT